MRILGAKPGECDAACPVRRTGGGGLTMSAALVHAGDRTELRLDGPWTLATASAIAMTLGRARLAAAQRLDASRLERIDTAGALLLLRAMRNCGLELAALAG